MTGACERRRPSHPGASRRLDVTSRHVTRSHVNDTRLPFHSFLPSLSLSFFSLDDAHKLSFSFWNGDLPFAQRWSTRRATGYPRYRFKLYFFFQAKLPLLAGSVLSTLLHLPFRRANSRQSLLQTTFCDSNSYPSIATTLFLYFTLSGLLCLASARASSSPRVRFFSCFCSNFT